MITLELGSDQRQQQRYALLEQRREALRREISGIYRRYDEHICSRLRASASSGGFLDLDAMPSDEEYAAYDLGNTPLTTLEEQLFKVSLAMQDLRLTAA